MPLPRKGVGSSGVRCYSAGRTGSGAPGTFDFPLDKAYNICAVIVCYNMQKEEGEMCMRKRVLILALCAVLVLLTGMTAETGITGTVVITGPPEGVQIGEGFDLVLGEEIETDAIGPVPTNNIETDSLITVTITGQMGDTETIAQGYLVYDGDANCARITVPAEASRALFRSPGSGTVRASFVCDCLDQEGALCQDISVASGAIPVKVSAGTPQLSAAVTCFGASGGDEFLVITAVCENGYLFHGGAGSAALWEVRLNNEILTLKSVRHDGGSAVIEIAGSAAGGDVLTLRALPGAFASSEEGSDTAPVSLPSHSAVPLHTAFVPADGLPAGLTWELTGNLPAPPQLRIEIISASGDIVYHTAVAAGSPALSVSEPAAGILRFTCNLEGWDPASLPPGGYSAVISTPDGLICSYGSQWTRQAVPESAPGVIPPFSGFPGGIAADTGAPVRQIENAATPEAARDGVRTVENADGSSVITMERPGSGTSTTVIRPDGQVAAAVTLSAEVIGSAQGGAIPLPMPPVSLYSGTEAPVVVVATGCPDPVKVEIPAEGAVSGTVAVIVRAGGEEVSHSSFATETGVIVTVSDGDTVRLEDRSGHFSDVSGHWAGDAIAFVSAHELFSGTGEDRFSPDGTMTRAMLLTVLARYNGTDTDGGAVWYEKGLAWAVENQISSGEDPGGEVSREQLVAMLCRYAAYAGMDSSARASLEHFADADEVSPYAGEAMAWAVATGLITGTDKGELLPRRSVTRSEAAAILMRFCEAVATSL